MSNAFDFELVASDQVSEAITRIEEAVGELEPALNKTKEGLQLGGQETQDSLSGVTSRFDLMARSARDNVQFIGDMVPPLKMVGEIAGKLGSVGLVGTAGYGLRQVAYGFREVSREAWNLDVSAKNAGMRVEDFSRLAGAMRLLGTDGESANASIEGVAKTLKEANSGSNAQALGAMAQIGAQIQRNKDGSVDTLKTLGEIARIFPTLRPEQQKSFADAMGLTPEMLALMREGSNLKALLAKSDKLGLTVDPELNKQLSEANRQMNEFSAAWDGVKNRAGGKISKFIMSLANDSKDAKGRRWQDGLNEGIKYDGTKFYHGDREKDIRWKALRDKEFKSSLSGSERLNFTLNRPDPEVEKKLNARYGATWQAWQLRDDLSAIGRPQAGTASGNVPYGQEKNNAIGFRNHNPGNLREASNTTGKNGGFSTFASDNDGLAAMARQLMLYGDRGNNALNGIIHTYAPKSENNTRAYIDSVSGDTGFDVRQRLNLHDPETLKVLMAAMIKHENGAQPFSEDQLKNAIQTAIMDDRWSGRRSTDALAQQRYDVMSGGNTTGHPDNPAIDDASPPKGNSIIQPTQRAGDPGQALVDNIAHSFKSAMEEQKLKLEITMVNDKGERRLYNVENNGRITTPLPY
ncbi:hypothetical protein [Serratia liquefaciens]|uniref:Uncharacterized protein n=1 Tax=Serratia liquefaciens TaxID=614 RepID=A0ABX7D1K4_SERLI|nr:hypothetical protein [Serratia liquefaciens]QQU53692.1 hypothetical protein I6I38_15265 [Serratia liquefaciens]